MKRFKLRAVTLLLLLVSIGASSNNLATSGTVEMSYAGVGSTAQVTDKVTVYCDSSDAGHACYNEAILSSRAVTNDAEGEGGWLRFDFGGTVSVKTFLVTVPENQTPDFTGSLTITTSDFNQTGEYDLTEVGTRGC